MNTLFVCDLIQVRLYAVAEENRENIECPDQEQARTYKRHYRLGDAVLARVHLDVYLTNGHDDVNPGYGATDILDIEQVLYFGYNTIDYQLNTKQQNSKCSQNETRIVLSVSVENGGIQLP